jgi:hypothetical protein
MRNFGFILLFGGILAFIYCMTQLSTLGPLPDGLGLGDYLRNPAGRLELGRYAALFSIVVGALLALFPKGR